MSSLDHRSLTPNAGFRVRFSTAPPVLSPFSPRSSPCPRAAQVKAHKTGLAHLVLSRSGKLLASSSARGTLLRVFDVESAKHLYSFRRGLTAAQVHSISFNRNETMLCGHFDEMLYGNLLFLFLVVVVVLLACVPRPYAWLAVASGTAVLCHGVCAPVA